MSKHNEALVERLISLAEAHGLETFTESLGAAMLVIADRGPAEFLAIKKGMNEVQRAIGIGRYWSDRGGQP